jgi:hypothetical protein
MDANRKSAIIVGALFIIGTAAGMTSAALMVPSLGAADYLSKISANSGQVTAGAFFVLIMSLSLAMIPAVLYPILKKRNEALAVGYVVFRGALETMITIAQVACIFVLVILSQKFTGAGAPGHSYFQTLGAVILGGHANLSALLSVVFPIGALMFYYVLYKERLIPRWLSGWGFIAAILYLFGGLYDLLSTEIVVLFLPMLVQEMVMAVWLIVKGFNPSATTVEAGEAQC